MLLLSHFDLQLIHRFSPSGVKNSPGPTDMNTEEIPVARDASVRQLTLVQVGIPRDLIRDGWELLMRILPRALTVLAMLGILLVFFFPAPCGPYSVTHGPATAFRAHASAQGLLAAMSTAFLMVAVLQCIFYLECLTAALFQMNYGPQISTLRC